MLLVLPVAGMILYIVMSTANVSGVAVPRRELAFLSRFCRDSGVNERFAPGETALPANGVDWRDQPLRDSHPRTVDSGRPRSLAISRWLQCLPRSLRASGNSSSRLAFFHPGACWGATFFFGLPYCLPARLATLSSWALTFS